MKESSTINMQHLKSSPHSTIATQIQSCMCINLIICRHVFHQVNMLCEVDYIIRETVDSLYRDGADTPIA